MSAHTVRKVRQPASLSAERVYRQATCLDAAQLERRERLEALRAALRSQRRGG